MTPFCTGPGFIYVSKSAFGSPSSAANVAPSGTPAKADILYLGTCEGTVRIRVNPEYEPIMNDVAGVRLPLDYSYQGRDAELVGTLTDWNEAVYQRLQKIVNSTLGTDAFGDIGTLMHLEGGTVHCWIHFPYTAKSTYTALGQPPCYHFGACRPIGEEMPVGTSASKRLFALKADRYYNPSDASMKLYDLSTGSYIPANASTTYVNAITGTLV